MPERRNRPAAASVSPDGPRIDPERPDAAAGRFRSRAGLVSVGFPLAPGGGLRGHAPELGTVV